MLHVTVLKSQEFHLKSEVTQCCFGLLTRLSSLCAASQVPGGFHLRQQHEAEGRRGLSLQPEVSEVAVYRLQHAAEGALGPRGDPAPDALRRRGGVRTRRPRPQRQVQGEVRAATGRTG